jgi:hypothetical protein
MASSSARCRKVLEIDVQPESRVGSSAMGTAAMGTLAMGTVVQSARGIEASFRWVVASMVGVARASHWWKFVVVWRDG